MVTPVDMVERMLAKISQEEVGDFKLVYAELKRLEEVYPKVVENQGRLDLGNDAMEFALANLLYSAHGAFCYPAEPMYTRKNALDALYLMANVAGGRIMMMEFLYGLFPQAVICVEHLFFLQRRIHRVFELPDQDRPEMFRGEVIEDWTFPSAAIDLLRVSTIEVWKTAEDKREDDKRKEGDVDADEIGG